MLDKLVKLATGLSNLLRLFGVLLVGLLVLIGFTITTEGDFDQETRLG